MDGFVDVSRALQGSAGVIRRPQYSEKAFGGAFLTKQLYVKTTSTHIYIYIYIYIVIYIAYIYIYMRVYMRPLGKV